MSLFVIVSSIVFVMVLSGLSLIGLINYTVNKVKGSREQKIADRHDELIQNRHFKD